MARRPSDSSTSGDRSKIRIFYAEAEGSTQSLQELMRTITATIGRSSHTITAQRMIANPALTPTDDSSPEASDQNEQPHGPAQDESSSTTEAGNSSAEPPARKRGDRGVRDRNVGLSIVKSLDLHPVGKVPLKDFVLQKKPGSQLQYIAVFVYYLERVVEASGIGFAHIYTCFKEVEERVPTDLPQTCRNAASQKGWIDTSDQNNITITTRGENLVDHGLPEAAPTTSAGTGPA